VLAHILNRAPAIDITESPPPKESKCNIFADEICNVILRDPFTVVLSLWAGLQLSWVTMLLFVQVVQISKATTTFESMRGHHGQGSRASDAITAALTTGSTSMNGAQTGSRSQHHENPHGHKEGCFSQWKKLLGLDTFVATAQEGLEGSRRSRRRQNPFTRGIITNCKDFWCDPAPYFGRRDIGAGMLDGEIVNYAQMYEVPPRAKTRRAHHNGNEAIYHRVGEEENA
jgi:palmitoyltransferase